MKTNFVSLPACAGALLVAILLLPGAARAEVRLASPFTSHMVLQREMTLKTSEVAGADGKFVPHRSNDCW